MTPTWSSPCGRAVLYCRDNLEVLPELEAGSVDAVITDPPYGFGNEDGSKLNGRYQLNRGAGGVGKVAEWRPLDCSDWNDSLPIEWLGVLPLVSGGACIAFTDTSRSTDLWDAYKDHLKPLRTLFWIKNSPPTCPAKNFRSGVEVAIFGRREGKVHCWNGGIGTLNYVRCPADNKDRVHPTQKPVRVMEWCIKPVTNPGHVILDPFMGSGTTGVAAIRLGRRFIGIEQDPGYFEAARKRIEAETSQGRIFSPPGEGDTTSGKGRQGTLLVPGSEDPPGGEG